jgi:beta-galactosidase
MNQNINKFKIFKIASKITKKQQPWWLLREEGIRLRTADPRYLRHVQRFFDALLPVLRPQLHANGGPVIMLQIENEYGSMGICDKPYLRWSVF